eukprot:scaffold83762_cov25-Prasinocladus_malaysianus.AAC.2
MHILLFQEYTEQEKTEFATVQVKNRLHEHSEMFREYVVPRVNDISRLPLAAVRRHYELCSIM